MLRMTLCNAWNALCNELYPFQRPLDTIIAPARSAGASYSETGVSNDLGVRSMCVRDEKTGKTPNGICAGQTRNLQR